MESLNDQFFEGILEVHPILVDVKLIEINSFPVLKTNVTFKTKNF